MESMAFLCVGGLPPRGQRLMKNGIEGWIFDAAIHKHLFAAFFWKRNPALGKLKAPQLDSREKQMGQKNASSL